MSASSRPVDAGDPPTSIMFEARMRGAVRVRVRAFASGDERMRRRRGLRARARLGAAAAHDRQRRGGDVDSAGGGGKQARRDTARSSQTGAIAPRARSRAAHFFAGTPPAVCRPTAVLNES